jgi:two-component system, NarL family, nitrate/nitrite response regulator NarL
MARIRHTLGIRRSQERPFPRSKELHANRPNLTSSLDASNAVQIVSSMGDPLRVLIADDHPLFLFAIAHSVNSREELELVGQARTGREAIAAALETRPDLAVLDVEMPDLGGLEVLEAMTREGLSTRVLFVSGSLDAAKSYNLIEAGAAGVLEKDAMPEEIGDALIRISQGETVLAPSVQAGLMREVRDRRERTRRPCSPAARPRCSSSSPPVCPRRRSRPSCTSPPPRSRRTSSVCTSGSGSATARRPWPRGCAAASSNKT